MQDITYILISVGFFILMILFAYVCDKA